MKLKVCGMASHTNIKDVAKLQPNYMGFIFYKKSVRYFDETMPQLPSQIKKVGVFVDETPKTILQTLKKHPLDAIQLHGQETSLYINELKQIIENADHKPEIIKAFSIDKSFNFETLKPYETLVDYFLFDTKGKLPGGNGHSFDWNLLKNYTFSKPYFLSGGIGLDELESLSSFLKTASARYCYAIDVNSKFEIKPGLKHTTLLKTFINELQRK